ncbi:uncharacterized protein CcaverHIS019_0404070 [Cutaneotrichosporon cavernicola]|uniref:Ribosome biogenesis protein NOP53 n=1 Tax=Cutaneotrichosporon cavernicola TaxID=279322 RepID=A0AA48L436_9TREE|nr:uncharacterized protein CcaverHIS019_0404070 [Cutaneotrichosporon cavernicola]BEI91587.1 hypothetical protein CcaverHIS019_0404070 [Cutaneotrichosporon cavernicola]BEI99364.1 hypothetical protein CcaverHIS631_0404070 [Cutaneotrichosporon cavernicola]BEJ07139.1 hypothetical protein CcaverHIS641_0404080 [Cutaneotrichosporon cavernicola]
MPATTSKTKTATKPYDRPAGKSKGAAPAQPKQSSRKGKKAWRKNVDITAVEAGLEAARAEERLTGGTVETRSNDALFTIDTEGDVAMTQQVRRKREKKPLRSLAVLHERSAVPSLTSRAKAAVAPKKISSTEKKRLRRTALKAEAEGHGTAASSMKATDTANLHDPWVAEKVAGLPGGWGDEGVVKIKPKAPETLTRQREIRREVDATQLDAELPRAGVSYNPSAPAHAALLEAAIAEEMSLLAAEERVEAEVAARGGVVEARHGVDDFGENMVGGMRIGRGDEEDEDEEEESSDEEDGYKPKQTKRKTQAQRNKAARAKALLVAERDEAIRRRMERHVGAARSMSKSVAARQREVEATTQQRRAAAKARERLGYTGGEKIGKHRVQKGAVAVQLGEDLAESLRQVKPEGNLFKDRFQSLQRRALIEPRVPQLPKKRKIKVKEYEKFAWKRFE